VKGEVTGAGKRPKTPAERLSLSGPQRAKSEKCLAEAVYFESRGEVKRGQIAVAQVVMNRVFSGFYPNNVCGVVYQNAHRKLACQFTFACDSVPDVIEEPDMWEQAKGNRPRLCSTQAVAVGDRHIHALPQLLVHPSWVTEYAEKLLQDRLCTAFYRRAPGAIPSRVPNHPFVAPKRSCNQISIVESTSSA
jgi:hypothetical protein